MIRTIARKEWVDLTRDGRFRGAALFVFLLSVVALGAGALHQRAVRAEREDARRLTRAQWLEQGEKNPHSAAHYGIWAFKPEASLAAFDPGLEPYTGVALYLEAHKQNPARYRPAADAPAAARLGELSGAGVLQLLVPLLVILLTFSAFTAEREAGTLRLLLASGVGRRQLVLGKALGVGLALALLLVPLLGVGVGVLLAAPEARGADTLVRGAGLVLGYGLYLGGFVFLGLAVSAWVRTSRMALLVLLGFWMANGLLVPRLASDVARAWAPVPTAETYARRVAEDYEKGVDGHNPADQRVAELEAKVLARYGVGSKAQLPVNFDGLALQAGEEYSNTVNERHQGELWAAWRQQESVLQAFAPVAPLMALRALSSGLAGTDLERHVHFSREAEAHRRLLVRHMNMAIAERSRPGDRDYKAGAELWQEVPEFRSTLPTWRASFAAQTSSLALLAGWCLLTAVLALRAGARLSPL